MIKQIDVPLTDDDLYGSQEKTQEPTEQFVLFRLDAEWYGIRIDVVQEVTQVLSMTRFPSLPHAIVGMTHLRGNILSVTDPKHILGLPETSLTKQHRLLVIKSQVAETALLVDEVAEIIIIPAHLLEPALITFSPEQACFIEYTCSWKERLIAILKAEKLLIAHSEANAA